jgi:hypothetical protein
MCELEILRNLILQLSFMSILEDDLGEAIPTLLIRRYKKTKPLSWIHTNYKKNLKSMQFVRYSVRDK